MASRYMVHTAYIAEIKRNLGLPMYAAPNAADVFSTLQVMQDFVVNLICVEDGIDSSKDAGKLMISVLSAVAEIERENIRVQTMEGRIQKAREGKWNGGFAPYEYHLVEQDNFLLVDGLHEAIISEEVWNAAQAKLIAQAKKYEHVNKGKNERTHLLSGIVKCPVCGAGMYGNKSIKYKKDGSKYKDFFYYRCKHRNMQRGHKCDYRKQIREELLDDAVAEVIVKLVSNPNFATMMQEKINMKVDTTAIDQEIANYEKQLRQNYSIKSKLMEEIVTLTQTTDIISDENQTLMPERKRHPLQRRKSQGIIFIKC